MSTSLITNYFRANQIDQLRESITEAANTTYYVFVGHPQAYDVSDNVVTQIYNTTQTVDVDAYRDMVFGKRVSSEDVKVMVPRYDWTAGKVYTPYDSANDVSNTNFYACVNAVSQYHIFKVLDNNSGAPSSVRPEFVDTAPDDDFYSTSDGYVWKYMYSVDRTMFNKFATDDYIPVVNNPNVTANAVAGAIDVVRISAGGSNYDSSFSNTFNVIDLRLGGNTLVYGLSSAASANDSFYVDSYIYINSGTGVGQIRKIKDYSVIGSTKKIVLDRAFDIAPDTTSAYDITPGVDIVGDGTGARARALVNTHAHAGNTIYQVEIVDKGSGYTFARAAVTGNTGGVANNAVVVPIIGPKGGHGRNSELELGGRYLGISVTFANTENGTIPTDNDYRTVGLLKDPLFANVALTLSSVVGTFSIGETVTQATSNAQGTVTTFIGGNQLELTGVSGVFVTAQPVTGVTSQATGIVTTYDISGVTKNFNTFDQRYRYAATAVSGTFKEDERVYQTTMGTANALFHSSNSSHVALTHVEGIINTSNTIIGSNSGAVATLLNYKMPDIVKGSGQVLYLENTLPISRSNVQSEMVKLILKF